MTARGEYSILQRGPSKHGTSSGVSRIFCHCLFALAHNNLSLESVRLFPELSSSRVSWVSRSPSAINRGTGTNHLTVSQAEPCCRSNPNTCQRCQMKHRSLSRRLYMGLYFYFWNKPDNCFYVPFIRPADCPRDSFQDRLPSGPRGRQKLWQSGGNPARTKERGDSNQMVSWLCWLSPKHSHPLMVAEVTLPKKYRMTQRKE